MLKISHADKQLELHSPVVMGILNTTPDSFSDGGRYVDLDVALARAQQIMTLASRLLILAVSQLDQALLMLL